MKNKDKRYFANKAATKNPKLLNITLVRGKDGQLYMLGNETLMLDRSGNKERYVRVNTRAVAALINSQGVIAA